jgi:Flp pilus assembly protein TadG
MILRGLLQRIREVAVTKLARDTRGAAAVELALITPAILAIFFGTGELSDLAAVDRKVTITARSLSDLVAQSTTISNQEMDNIFNATTSIMTPYAVSPLTARVSAVNIDSSGNATIRWSSARGTTERPPGSAVTIPTALAVPDTQLIWSEISYGYRSPVSHFIVGTLNMTDQFFARPRESSTICRPPAVTTCS